MLLLSWRGKRTKHNWRRGAAGDRGVGEDRAK